MYKKKTFLLSDEQTKSQSLLSLNTKKTIWNQEMFDISAKRLKQFINYENIRSFAR